MDNLPEFTQFVQLTQKSLINEQARLAFLEKNSTILSIFHVINIKFHHSRLLIYLVDKQTGWHFFPPYSFILLCSFIRDFRVLGKYICPDLVWSGMTRPANLSVWSCPGWTLISPVRLRPTACSPIFEFFRDTFFS